MLKLVIGMPAKQHAGFTLIEILVVLVIISIVMTFAMLSFGDFGARRAVIAEGQQLVHEINLAKQEAILESTTLAIRIHNRGYQVMRFKEPNQWQPIKSSVFQHTFSRKMRIQLNAQKQKQLLINSAGFITPFELNLGTESEPQMIIITGHADGSLTLKNHE